MQEGREWEEGVDGAQVEALEKMQGQSIATSLTNIPETRKHHYSFPALHMGLFSISHPLCGNQLRYYCVQQKSIHGASILWVECRR